MKKKYILYILLIIVIIGLILFFISLNSKKFIPCEFVRTYRVENIIDSNDENYLFITIRSFQDEDVQTIKIKKGSEQIKEKDNYEFKFRLTKKITNDSILEIYNNSEIISINRTDKTGLEQINDDLCFKKN